MKPACSDEEFMRLWKEIKSPHKLSRHLGITPASVFKRRRNLEIKYGVDLESSLHAETTVVARHEARVYYEFENGIAIVFSDAHFWPGIDTTAYRALLYFIDNLKPKVICCNGDAFDGSSISRFPPIGWEKVPTVKEELDAVEDHLTRIEDIAKAKLVWTLGNHDSRYEARLAVNAPQYRGIERFHLKDHFQKWLPCWSFWLNDTICKHRFKGGVNAAYNNTLHAGRSIVTGHDHLLYDRAFRDANGIRHGIDTGMLADVDGPQFVDYTEDNPTGWNSGFYVLTYSGGKLLAPEKILVISEGEVEFRGQRMKV